MATGNRRSRMTKMLFQTSLMELMAEKSIHKITIQDICDGADLNRSTFYLHYTNQYHLLADVENKIMDKMMTYIKQIDTGIDPVTYVKELLDYLHANKQISVTLFNSDETKAFQMMFVDSIINHIKETVGEGLPTVRGKYVYAYIMQGAFNMIREWINSEFDLASYEVAKLMVQLHITSLGVGENS